MPTLSLACRMGSTLRLAAIVCLMHAFAPSLGHAAAAPVRCEAEVRSRLKAANLGSEIAGVSALTEGFSGALAIRVDLADGRSYFAKIVLDWAQARNAAELRQEMQRAQVAGDLDLGPQVVFVDADSGLLVTEFLGNDMGSWAEGGLEPRLSATLLTLRRLHDSEPEGLPKKLSATRALARWAKERARVRAEDLDDPYVALADTLAQRAIAQLQGMPFSPVPRHGDMHQDNVRFTQGRAWFVDWEAFNHGDPMEELANYFYHIDTPISDAAHAARSYGELGPEDCTRLKLHLALIHADRYLRTLRGMPWDLPQWRPQKIALHQNYLQDDSAWLETPGAKACP